MGPSRYTVHVREWRRERLRRAGLPPEAARKLADDPRLDLHALLELIERGCPSDVAARIVAPLDERADADDRPRD
jgi:hypothetical protein